MRPPAKAMAMAMVAWVGGACAPYLAVPTAMHPTSTANEKSVGVAGGGVYVNPEDTDSQELTVLPHAEGWIHVPVAQNAQVGVHLGPSIGHVALRFDLLPMSGGPGVAIQPFLGGGYANIEQDMDVGGSVTSIAGGLNVMLLVPAGAGHAYLVPKLGYGWFNQSDDNPMTEDDSVNLYTLGLSAGIDLGGTSIEITVHRVDDAEDTEPDDAAVWVVVPTIGVRH